MTIFNFTVISICLLSKLKVDESILFQAKTLILLINSIFKFGIPSVLFNTNTAYTNVNNLHTGRTATFNFKSTYNNEMWKMLFISLM